MLSVKKPDPAKGPSGLGRLWLIVYNVASMFGWLYCLYTVLPIIVDTVMDFDAFKLPSAYPVMGKTLLWVQTGAALEIIHAMTGLVRAPLFTTIIQVFSRLAVTWGLLELTPVTQTSSAVTCVFFAWSTVEVVRYAFYALNLMGIHQHAVTWCRYTLFYVLYPLGVASEMTLLYRGWQARGETPVGYMYLAFLALWGPGFIKMYTHMMVQRRKVIPSRRIHTAVKDQ